MITIAIAMFLTGTIFGLAASCYVKNVIKNSVEPYYKMLQYDN